jgi:hypothetical protein
MKIKCKLKRKGGTRAEVFGKEYHFKPEDKTLKPDDPAYLEADHVCDVDDPNAVYRLCAQIREGYELANPEKDTIPAPTRKVGQTIAADKKEAGEKKPVLIRDQNGNEINLTELEPEDLRNLAREEFGVKVHGKWDDQTVITKIIEKTRGEG